MERISKWSDQDPELGTCQKLAGGEGGGDFQSSDKNTMTLPR